MKVLIIDDEYVALTKLRLFFEACCELHSANSGEEAYEIFKKSMEQKEPFDLVVIDIDMPGMTGLDLLEKMNSLEQASFSDNHEFKTSKKIMLTAKTTPRNVMGSFRNQADAFVSKPFRNSEMIKVLDRIGIMIENDSE